MVGTHAAGSDSSTLRLEPDVKNENLWYVLNLQGQQAGWMHSKQSVKGGNVVNESEMRMSIARGTVVVKIQVASRFTETMDGEPISMWSLQKMAKSPREINYTFEPDGVRIVASEAGQKTESHQGLPAGEWFTPGEASRYLQQRLSDGATKITMRLIDPMGDLKPITETHELLEKDVPIDVNGRTISTTKWKVTQDQLPGVDQVQYLDKEGTLIKGVIPYGGLDMVYLLSNETAARHLTKAPELMVSTFVKPTGKPLSDSLSTTRVVMDLSVDDGSMPSLPTEGPQTVEKTDQGLRLTVVRDAHQKATADELAHLDDFRSASSLLQKDDPRIVDLAHKAMSSLAKDAADTDKSEAIRAFVHTYIRAKDLGVGFASASEVASNREGDCTEHAVLTAAILRAADIPARVVTGLIYAESFAGQSAIFGYHMWTQALIDGAWVDYDATLPVRFDATHIALWTSALKDNSSMNDMSSVLTVLGRLKINIVEVEH